MAGSNLHEWHFLLPQGMTIDVGTHFTSMDNVFLIAVYMLFNRNLYISVQRTFVF